MQDKEKQFAARLLIECQYKPYKGGIAIFFSGDKQLMYYLEKWSQKGWWESGVTLRSGWFSEAGIEHFKQVDYKIDDFTGGQNELT